MKLTRRELIVRAAKSVGIIPFLNLETISYSKVVSPTWYFAVAFDGGIINATCAEIQIREIVDSQIVSSGSWVLLDTLAGYAIFDVIHDFEKGQKIKISAYQDGIRYFLDAEITKITNYLHEGRQRICFIYSPPKIEESRIAKNLGKVYIKDIYIGDLIDFNK